MATASGRPQQELHWSIARVVVPYAGFAALWILVSDWALERRFPDATTYLAFSTIKGLFFVAVTAALLAVLLRLELSRRAATERALQSTTSQLERAQQVAHLGMWAWNIPDGRLEWSDQMFTIFGLPRDLLRGDPRAVIVNAIHPEDRERVVEAHRAAIAEKAPSRLEYRVMRPDGTVRVVWAEGADVVTDETGTPVRITGIVQDITERKQMERQLLRAQRAEAAGALASGIAHDLNNVLTPVMMIAPLLRGRVVDREDREMLDTLEQVAQRGSEVIRNLLTFARGEPAVRAPLSLASLMGEVERIARETFPRDIELEVQAPPDPWEVEGDATQLHQVLLNLCLNARDAMPEGGRLTMAAANVTVSEQETHGDAQPGPFVRVSVCDAGVGIAPEHLERIFDPFFTTKDVGKGTGLGLSSVLGIVRGHQGFVRVESQRGVGSRFDVYLPARLR